LLIVNQPFDYEEKDPNSPNLQIQQTTNIETPDKRPFNYQQNQLLTDTKTIRSNHDSQRAGFYQC
jgi:hypothetical protein